MQLKSDWLIVLENLRRGIMVTDANLQAPTGPRILQGRRTDRAVAGSLKKKVLRREVFHGQTWNHRKNGEPFLMNGYCYAIHGERGKPLYYVAEQEDVAKLESLRMKQRLMINPQDDEALQFFQILKDWKNGRKAA
jgi:hypothetical protein